MTKSLTNSKILIINKQLGGFSLAQKNMAKSHQEKFGVVVVKEADIDAPEFIYIECDPEKRKAQTALAEIAKVKESKALALADVAVTPAICEKLPKLVEKVSSDGSRSWGFATGIFGG